MPKLELEPPDPNRCQAEKLQYNPFILGGDVYQRLRCPNKPHWLIEEVAHNGGSMTVCDECAEVFIDKQVLPPNKYILEWLDAAPTRGEDAKRT